MATKNFNASTVTGARRTVRRNTDGNRRVLENASREMGRRTEEARNRHPVINNAEARAEGAARRRISQYNNTLGMLRMGDAGLSGNRETARKSAGPARPMALSSGLPSSRPMANSAVRANDNRGRIAGRTSRGNTGEASNAIKQAFREAQAKKKK